jgi:2-amino-4-hydroxy-6-hydroxymethyldihydropteridine diphosphokinase
VTPRRSDPNGGQVAAAVIGERPPADRRERIFIGIGGNEPGTALAIDSIQAELYHVGIEVVAISTIIETAAWGRTNQAPFLNAVAEIVTTVSPTSLLGQLKRIETALGRVPTTRWGPRLIDLDLLAYGSREFAVSGLALPHPGIGQRGFVLTPWAEIAPEFEIVGLGRVGDLASRIGIVPRAGR